MVPTLAPDDYQTYLRSLAERIAVAPPTYENIPARKLKRHAIVSLKELICERMDGPLTLSAASIAEVIRAHALAHGGGYTFNARYIADWFRVWNGQATRKTLGRVLPELATIRDTSAKSQALVHSVSAECKITGAAYQHLCVLLFTRAKQSGR